MKRLFSVFLTVLLCACMAFPIPARSLPETDFPIPFSQEALLSALYNADIAALRQAIDLKLVTCEELTAYYLDRIAAYNEPYNCFITLCDDALEIARQRDRQLARGQAEGLLFGIPVVIKDNMHYQGYWTTNGCDYEDAVFPDHNAEVVNRLLDEGAVIIAKANMSEEAESARESTSLTVGETKNAYNPLLVSGGSSGGSAVATALNFAAAGLGTDTNASLRIPAVLNGCVALRPTFGLIPIDGIIPLNSTRDIPGAITRTVADQALMLDVLTNSAYHFTENLNSNALSGLRLGILEELLNLEEPDTDPDIISRFYQVMEELEACGAEVVTVSMPDLIYLSDATFETNDQYYKDELYYAFTELLSHHELDAVVYPICTSAPVRSGLDEDGVFWDPYEQEFLNNSYVLAPCAQLPAIAFPMGYHDMGSGLGIEIVADKYCDQLLLDIAYTYTLRFDHREDPSGAPDAYGDAHAGDLQTLIAAYLRAEAEFPEPTDPPAPSAPAQTPTEPAVPPADPQDPPSPPAAPSVETLVLILLALAAGLLLILILQLGRSRKTGKYAKKKKSVKK